MPLAAMSCCSFRGRKATRQLPDHPDSASRRLPRKEALERLKDEPDYDTLVFVLRYLVSEVASSDVRHPSPVSAQIVQVLVTEIVPNYWVLLKEESYGEAPGKPGRKVASRDLLLQCLRSITGLHALLVRLRVLLAEAKVAKTKHQDTLLSLGILIELLSDLLEGEDSIQRLWDASVSTTDPESRRKPLSQELVSTIGGARILSLAAEAEKLMQTASELGSERWLSEGRAYSSWLVANITRWVLQDQTPEETRLCADLFLKAFAARIPRYELFRWPANECYCRC